MTTEIGDLEHALKIIVSAEQISRNVAESTVPELVRTETRAAAAKLNNACAHLRAAILALEKI